MTFFVLKYVSVASHYYFRGLWGTTW